MPKVKFQSEEEQENQPVLIDLTGLHPSIQEHGDRESLLLLIPSLTIDPRILRDLAVDLGFKTPDALVDRLYQVIREHSILEILSGRVIPQER